MNHSYPRSGQGTGSGYGHDRDLEDDESRGRRDHNQGRHQGRGQDQDFSRASYVSPYQGRSSHDQHARGNPEYRSGGYEQGRFGGMHDQGASPMREFDEGRRFAGDDYGARQHGMGAYDEPEYRNHSSGGGRYGRTDFGRSAGRDDIREGLSLGSGYLPQQFGQDEHDQGEHRDPDYTEWRREQMRKLDDDYSAWRKDRQKKFSEEFDTWRKDRKPEDVGGTTSTGSATQAGATLGTTPGITRNR